MVPLSGGGAGGSGCRPRLVPCRLAGRPLLSLGLLQLLLGLCTVALSWGATTISLSQPVRRACPFWPGASVILSGIVGLTTWRRPLLLLVNIFVVLSVMCVLLNLAAFILCCQGAQLVSSMNTCTLSETGDACHCCSLSPTSECPEDKLLLLSPGSSCTTMRILLKKVLSALSALNALSTAVCVVAAALRYLQMFNTRPPGVTEESGVPVEDGTEPDPLPDPEEFVAPAPPPSYFSMFYSYTPRLARRMFGDSMVPHASGVRMKGAELFLDPPPPYEEVAGSSAPNTTLTQETELSAITCSAPVRGPVSDVCLQSASRVSEGSPPPSPPKRWVGRQQQAVGSTMSSQTAAQGSLSSQTAPQGSLSSQRSARIHRSNSDPLLTDLTTKVVTPDSLPARVTTDSATQTSQPTLLANPSGQAAGSIPPWRRRGGGGGGGGGGAGNEGTSTSSSRGSGVRRPRPSSMVDYQSYQHTQQLVSRFLEQPSPSARRGLLNPEVHRLVESIRTVLQLDQQHMEEVVRSASYIEQAFTESETAGDRARHHQPISRHHGRAPIPPPPLPSQTLPLPPRKRAGLLHLRSCGDLSSFTCSADHRGPERRGAPARAGAEWEAPPRAPPRAAGAQSPTRPSEWPRATLRPGSRREHHDRPHSLIGIVRETIL